MAKLTSQIVLNVEPTLRQSLEAEAVRDRRPLASMIRKVLADYVDHEEGRSPRIDVRERARA
jgi:hypothetical protein